MCGRLIREDVGNDPPRQEALEEVHRIGADADRDGFLRVPRLERAVDRRVEPVDPHVEVTRREALVDARRVHLGDEGRPSAHRDRERLRAAHAPEARRHREPPRERAVRRAEVPPRGFRERLVRALEDSLRPDVDPGARGHLSVHRQAEGLEATEFVPGAPFRHQVRVRDEDPRGVGMRPEDPDRLAGLDEQRLVVAEPLQLPEDRLEALGVPGRLAGPAVHDEVLPPLGDLGVEVVEQHAVRGFGEPRAARQERAFRQRGRGVRRGGGGCGHRPDVSPRPEG